MPRNLTEAQQQVEVAEIRYHSDALMIPNGMSVQSAIDLLERQRMLERVESGEMSEAQAVAAMRVSFAKDRTKAMKQSENSNIPLPCRMGVSKKGYTRSMTL